MVNANPGVTETGISPALPSDLKEQNRKIVLSVFRDNQEHTAAEISSVTGISKLTVKRAIQFFCQNDTLESCGMGSSTELGGKKPEIFSLSCRKYLLNITVWPDRLSLTLFDIGGSKTGAESIDWEIPDSPDDAFAAIDAHSKVLLRSCGVSTDMLFGVNFSTSGIVDYDNLILKYNVNSKGWGTNVDIGSLLRKTFGDVPCFTAENTVKSISRAVLQNQRDTQRRTLVVFCAWGLSASLVQNGQIQNGRDSIIGEVGHMIIDPADTELCSCGSRGCLERLVSVARVRSRMSAHMPPPDSILSSTPPETLTMKMLFDASRAGDEYAREHVSYLADCFSVMLRNVALSFNPEAVVFVGDYACADEYFERCIVHKLESLRYFPSIPFEIRYDDRPLDELDAVGGSIMLQEKFFAQPSLYAD